MMKKANSGLTLIEVAIAMVIGGIVIAAMIDLYSRSIQQQRLQTTYDNMNTIVQALSTYTETAGRVPCPADPSLSDLRFGWEYGVTPLMLQLQAAQFPVGSCGTAGSVNGGAKGPTEGILPFMTLGLPASAAMDGWGHYFTYAVSPAFARQNDQTSSGTSDTGTLHGRCRHDGWVNTTDKYNRNAIKARFCCADQTPPIYDAPTDLVINHISGTLLSPLRAANSATSDGSANYNVDAGVTVYNNIDITTTKTNTGIAVPSFEVSSPDELIEAPAFVLISHGPYGYGAYEGNNTAGRIAVPGGYTTESKNVHLAPSNVYVDGPVSSAGGANYFDNIVRWMTQDGVLAAHGALSCDYP